MPPLSVRAFDVPSLTEQVAGGCGPRRWRGPYGECRSTPYYGRLPDGRYQPAPHPVFGCPPGYWHGPWGHCRDTAYHGRLPGGGWRNYAALARLAISTKFGENFRRAL